ncbi:putative disease resistance protein [Arabidopsis thaliana]|uniref:Receptor like protein n=1 Tax=Arabidopsis thaliana TaxID=3702 RepID=Q9SVM2_ARATH|nr:putative disease resistance protein [Arabidopsis thaliana]CAB78433.1 putative disease resistance protein [Arabidopsis thaliana]
MSSLSKLEAFDIDGNSFSGTIPSSLFMIPSLDRLNLGRNHFSGPLEIGNISSQSNLQILYIGENNFDGPIPRSISKLVGLSELSLSFWNTRRSIVDFSIFLHLKSLESLDLSYLNTRSMVEFSLFSPLMSLGYLDLSGISLKFSSTLHLPSSLIEYLILTSCNISEFPTFLQNQTSLEYLDISANQIEGQLSGQLPKSLIKCTDLEFLNVEDNRINDKFPFWLRSLSNLQILVLRSNEFYGPIFSPGDSLSFPKLRIFDISENRFTGVLPSDYFVGWSAMLSVVSIYDSTRGYAVLGAIREAYHKSVVLTNKGLNMELVGSGFTIYKTIDVSGNRLEGDIPESIGILKELIVLNMSNNAFTGHIPPSLSNLSNLQSLDLSQNRLSGSIPGELGELTFLARMNFSYNRLEGPIPQTTQIQTQDSSSFTGNPSLCGAPLEEPCGREEDEEATKQEQDEDKEEEDQVFSWIAAEIGYVPGLFCGLAIGHILTSYKLDWFMRIFSCFSSPLIK